LAKVAKLLASLDPGQMQRRLPAKAFAQAQIAVLARGFFGVQPPSSGATKGATLSEKPDSINSQK